MFHRLPSQLVYKSTWIAILTALLLCSPTYSQSRSRTLTDGYTPTGAAPGSPAGAFPLSGFDTINLFNGNMNFRLPLLHIGGRGAAGYTMMLPLPSQWAGWEIRRTYQNDNSGIYWDDAMGRFTEAPPPYSAGKMIGISTSTEFIQGPDCNSQSHPLYTLTRLRFITPDGTEYYLHDERFQGAPKFDDLCNSTLEANRGKVFRTPDGGSMTFVSDTDISDYRYAGYHTEFQVSGYLLMSDGTRYRIVNNLIRWIQDRSGN